MNKKKGAQLNKTIIALKNYRGDNYKPEIGKQGGWFNTDPELPKYVPWSLIEKEYKDRAHSYRPYLEMPDQIAQVGDKTQKGLILCLWKAMQQDPNSSTFTDVHEDHQLYKCVKCDGLGFECDGYRYDLKGLREYNQTLK